MPKTTLSGHRPELPLEHFTLQLQYAQRAMEISGIPLAQALMEYTQYWRRVGNKGWSFDPEAPLWTELITRIRNGEEADVGAYELYSKTIGGIETEKDQARFGCFRFDYETKQECDKGIIRIHFKNRDGSGDGPLSKERQPVRLEELREMFQYIKNTFPDAKSVQGGSWLYNIFAYRRLFPEAYTADMGIEAVPFPRTSGIWGQFIDSEGTVKRDLAEQFLQRTAQANSVHTLLQCFEYKILFPKCDIHYFYDFYRIA